LNYDAGIATVVSVDGRIETMRISIPQGVSGLVTHSTFLPLESRMEFVAAGRTLTMTIGTVHDRCKTPTVYLDQKDWIDFARWEKDSSLLPASKGEFFKVLAAAASDGHVAVPISSAHLSETSKRGGTSRIELASTILRYSRGWQMRSVLALRRAELRALFGGSPLTKDDVVTLSPNAVLDMKPGPPIAPDLSEELSGLLERQVWASVLTDLMIDSKPTPDSGKDTAARWAQSFQPLATSIAGNGKAKARLRELTRLRFITDLGSDLPAAANESGLTPEEFGEWLGGKAERDIAASPGLGRMREILHLRLSNAEERWESNDLNDWFHLSYAAAYCDLVVGEKKTINYLRRAPAPVQMGAKIHSRAEDALPDLQQLLESSQQRG
jgi:hypothetical protein